jgi:hypothetical protein
VGKVKQLLNKKVIERDNMVKTNQNLASKDKASGQIRTDDRRFTKPLLYP